jgi:hypothetical protein
MDSPERTRLNELLDVLADAVAERLRIRQELQSPANADKAQGEELAQAPGDLAVRADDNLRDVAPGPEPPIPLVEANPPETVEPAVDGGSTEVPIEESSVLRAARMHAARSLLRLALGLLVLIVLINIPFNRHGTALARALPGSSALVMRDGLIVKVRVPMERCARS